MSLHANHSSSTLGAPPGIVLTDSYGKPITPPAFLPFTLIFLQCALLHPTFVHSRLARLVRHSLTPINVTWVFMFPFRYNYRPLEVSGQKNMVLATFSIYATLMCLEWGFATGPYYKRPLKNVDGVKRWEKDTSDSYKKAQEDEPRTAFKLITWTLLQMSSMRGVQFTWGPVMVAKEHSSLYLIGRILRLSIPLTAALALIVLTRDSPLGTPTSAFLSIGVPNLPGLMIFAEVIYTVSFGAWLSCKTDLLYTLLIIIAGLFHQISTFFGCSEPILELCDPVYYQLMFDSPQASNSVADFWGKAWHVFLKRNFISCGGKPAAWITQKLGGTSRTQKVAGLFGVFAVSAFFHEYVILGYVQSPNQSPGMFKTFPGSALFFLLQPLVMLIEPVIIPLIPKKIGGGKLWVWVVTTILCIPFRDQYLAKNGFIRCLPPLSEWTWLYIISPIKD